MSIPAVPCPIYHSPFSINLKKEDIPRFFFSFIIAFMFALRRGYSKNSNFEFLEAQISYKREPFGSHKRSSINVQKQSRKQGEKQVRKSQN
ncbi:hypothetical protein MTR67_008196 [Solanum verrucosum]|uniref:Uncharacterized protein n=1 Tax=Solanum verrucosum TaxID=315347 RepID=A0AAF0TDE2_SOLVR|nr:hypothetical protein MTR67_008196 [Solanum verrucosum]